MNQIFTIIRRHWMPLLGLNNVLLAATYAATIYAGMTSNPVWTASAQLNLPERTGDLNASLGTLGSVQNGGIGFSKNINPLQIQSTILTSDVVLSRVWAADPERSLYPSLNSYKGLFEVTPQEQTTIIVLGAEGSSPELARERVANLIQVYQQRLNELRRNDNNIREQFAQEELEKARRELTQAQLALSNFQQSTGLSNISEQTNGLIGAIGSLKTKQATVMAEAQANETQARVAAAGLGMTPQQAMNSLRLGENKEYQAIREKVSQVETALAEVRGKYTDESPQVQSLLLQRQELLRERNQRFAAVIPNAKPEEVDITLGGNGSRDSRIDMIAELVRTQNAAKGLQQQANQLQSQVNKFSTELSSISKNQGQFAELQRKYEIAEGVYKGIIAQLQQTKTNPFNTYPNVQTLDEPAINPKPSEPKLWLIAVGGVLASIFGSIALVLFLEARKPLLSAKDLQQVEFPVLGRISRLKHPNMERYLEADTDINFQRLAAAVSCLTLENNRLMVTSATFGEGKTTVTLGLALALVNFGFRVLVVDGDLRQAEMSRRLRHPQSEIKANSKQTPVSIYPGLDLMPAPSIPKNKIGEFFARGSFERCLSAIQDSGCYDYVLVDSAPVGLASETTLMSEVVRNVLFVVRPGTSDRYSVMDGFEQLAQHNARIRGLVVNGVESQTEGYRYGRQRELLEAEA
jgi:uncharacterized protein involved in exopolysaccharide biosynthesis